MSEYEIGTIIESVTTPEVQYEYMPRWEDDDMPWLALNVPDLLTTLFGDSFGEVRFEVNDVGEGIEDGSLVVIYTP